MKFIDVFRRHALIITAVLLLVLIVSNTIIALLNNVFLHQKDAVSVQVRDAIYNTDQVWNQVVRNVDIGMRGYALLKGDSLGTPEELDGLIRPMKDGIRDLPMIINDLRLITDKQNFEQSEAIDSLEHMAKVFIGKTEEMVAFVDRGQRAEFFAELRKDPGRDAWFVYDRNSRVIRDFENNLNAEATASYDAWNRVNLYSQLAVGIIAVFTLGFMIYKMNSDRKSKKDLFAKLEANNREFIFDPGNETGGRINENDVIDNSIRNFKLASEFIGEVSEGNFGVRWRGMTPENEKKNVSNLAGKLIQMRDRMRSIRAQEEVRNWVTEGLAKFSDVIREHQNNFEALSYNILVYIVNYMKAQQGCLFVLKESVEGDAYLEMAACYAFNRKKYVTKRISPGDGVIGQTYLEGKPLLLTDVPSGYTEITSGLGEATPTCVLIVPMKYNETVEGVIEIAGFIPYEKHQVEFMEKVGEITASTMGSVRNTEKMQELVDQFKGQAEQLRAQEEELRQNMEEMEATQEAMRRQERGV